MSYPLHVSRELPKLTAEHLKTMIRERGLESGDQIPSESDMVKMFGVGRSTIREAVKILVTENIVEIKRGRGTFVSSRPGLTNDPFGLAFTDQNRLLYNLFETRLIVEPQIAYLAAQRATEEDIKNLLQTLDLFTGLSPEDHEVFSLYDIRLHTLISQCTGNDVLNRFLPSICESINKGQVKTANNYHSQKKANDSHEKIIRAIQNKDPIAARQETDKHIRETAKDIKIILGGNIHA